MKYCVEPHHNLHSILPKPKGIFNKSELNNVFHGHFRNISSLSIVLLSFIRSGFLERERERARLVGEFSCCFLNYVKIVI